MITLSLGLNRQVTVYLRSLLEMPFDDIHPTVNLMEVASYLLTRLSSNLNGFE